MTGKVAVYIGTTNGPVRIERIIREPVPLSEVFVGRGIEPLGGISSDYDNFVRPGRPVAKAFGPFGEMAFRMDLSREIKTGQSWQLAAFVAHGLEAQGRLAGPDDIPDRVAVLTGTVDADFNVGPVGHIPQKLQALDSLLVETRKQGIGIDVLIPAAEANEHHSDKPVVTVSNAMEAFQKCAGEVETTQKFTETGAEPRRNHNTLWLALIGLGILAGGYGYATLSPTAPASQASQVVAQMPEDPAPQPSVVEKSGNQKPSLEIFERRSPVGKTCAQVQFSGVEAERISVLRIDGNSFAPSSHEGLCGLEFVFLSPDKENPSKAWLRVESGKFVGQRSQVTEKAFERELTWSIDLPSFQQAPFKYTVGIDAANAKQELRHMVTP